MNLRCVAALGLSFGLLLASAAGASPDRVRIHDGRLQGVVKDGVASFKDIPFAAPPVGDLRWQAPQPPAPWRGVRDASDYGPACLQMTTFLVRPGVTQSEDCLTINVFTPAHRARGAKLPVMVWIYGGAFIGGSANNYDGSKFARDGVVLVTFNYRLGRLGFFAHPALAKTNPEGALSDYGFADQIAALKWVKRNIAGFGGDPARVTIFGESAGAISVNYLLVSPMARGLFIRAASESGFGRTQGSPLAAAEATGAAFMKGLGVSGDDAAAVQAMRALPASAVMAPVSGLGDPGRGPIIDGVIVSESPGQGFALGHQARVPYLTGGNSFEASLFASRLTHPEAVLDRLGAGKDAAVALYGDGDPAKAVAALTTLRAVIEPDRYLARENAKRGVPTYVYYFSYLPEAERATAMGVRHSGEISYVFDTLPKTDMTFGRYHFSAATPADEAIARAAHAYWVAFGKTGHPGGAGGPRWPKAEPGDVVLEFGDDGPVVRPDFDRAKLDPLTARAGTGAQ
ncbi:MAG TPA: carboxylesterase family protein [Caulobacteraceae bacterium]|nr:carboxylesterase family protein [Caulobacteraceae bacterium]